MKVKEGDKIVCSSKDCDIELTVTKACGSTCGEGCDIEAKCSGEPMIVKPK